jgi:hypothetical protein
MQNQFKKMALILALISGIGINARAQSEGSTGIRYSIGVDGGLPVSNLSNNYKWSLGGSIQADLPIIDEQFYITINTGYNNIFAEKKANINIPDVHLIPVKVGLKYFAVANFYVQGEAGVSFILNDGPLLNKSASFTWVPQIGYLIPVGAKGFIDAGFRFEGNGKFYDGGKSNKFLGLRIAYAFPLGDN